MNKEQVLLESKGWRDDTTITLAKELLEDSVDILVSYDGTEDSLTGLKALIDETEARLRGIHDLLDDRPTEGSPEMSHWEMRNYGNRLMQVYNDNDK